MKMVQHPNVVRLYEVIDTATKLYLILELGDGGDMYDCIMKHEGGLSEEVRCSAPPPQKTPTRGRADKKTDSSQNEKQPEGSGKVPVKENFQDRKDPLNKFNPTFKVIIGTNVCHNKLAFYQKFNPLMPVFIPSYETK